MNYKGMQQSPSIFHEHPFTFSSLFFLFWHVQHSFFQKKVLFLSVSSQKKAGVRECRQESEKRGEKNDHRERKRSFDGFGERGIDGRRAVKVRQ